MRESKRPYGESWRRARRVYLLANPLCVHCLAKGLHTPATDVDHVKAWNAGGEFWNESNWQALCHSCHSIKTARYDRGLTDKGGDTSGYVPNDPAHHWK